VAWHYQDLLRDAAEDMDYKVGNILQSPLGGLVGYHLAK